MTKQQAMEKLKKYGQEHVLAYYDALTASQQAQLLAQIEEIDFSVLEQLSHKDAPAARGTITPIRAMQLPEITKDRETYMSIGTQAIRAGKVAAVLLAGGMGTRLGSEDPKGMYDIGITKPIYIFERLIQNLFDVVNLTGSWIPLFIMTSDKNHDATTAFFRKKNNFGYPAEQIHFFRQEMAPACTRDGKVFMESKYRIATSPNGNGGWFSSLKQAGLLSLIHDRGIEWLNVFAVDNVLQRIADPCFIGATLSHHCNVGAKVVRKADPDEKVGVMCLEDGRPSIVEYYEQTDQLRNTKDADGNPAYNFGVILNYLFHERSLEDICDASLPLHVVEKKIPHINASGEFIKPEEPNGYKFESLILDMIHLLDTCLPYEVVREKEFAPVKNKTGVDSVESARKLLQQNGLTL